MQNSIQSIKKFIQDTALIPFVYTVILVCITLHIGLSIDNFYRLHIDDDNLFMLFSGYLFAISPFLVAYLCFACNIKRINYKVLNCYNVLCALIYAWLCLTIPRDIIDYPSIFLLAIPVYFIIYYSIYIFRDKRFIFWILNILFLSCAGIILFIYDVLSYIRYHGW